MVRYRSNFVAGGTFFFTVALQDRRSDLLIRHIGLLREAFDVTRSSRPFHTEALVVLPDHIHAVWTLPPATAISRVDGERSNHAVCANCTNPAFRCLETLVEKH